MTEFTDARTFLARAMNIEIARVPDAARIGSFELWDSLAHMRVLLSIEERIGRRLDPDEAVRIESLADIARLLQQAA